MSNLNFTHVWLNALAHVLMGDQVSPRGKLTREQPQKTIVVDMRRPVLTVPERKLSYRFMAAEAFWILSGDNRVETIAPYNAQITQFSDNGETFFGAYGPRIQEQLSYVVAKLINDRDSRQAGMTVWRPNPPETKDVPCTIALFFNIRGNALNAHVFMRSNDLWLGTPYDVFNFSMLAHLICGHLVEAGVEVVPGLLYLTAASSHIYEQHWEAAGELRNVFNTLPVQPEVPAEYHRNPQMLMLMLHDLRETKPGDPLRWWEAT